jgi:hypothetical protein
MYVPSRTCKIKHSSLTLSSLSRPFVARMLSYCSKRLLQQLHHLCKYVMLI